MARTIPAGEGAHKQRLDHVAMGTRPAKARFGGVVVLQEGGYFVPHLGENIRNWLLGLEGRDPDLSKLA